MAEAVLNLRRLRCKPDIVDTSLVVETSPLHSLTQSAGVNVPTPSHCEHSAQVGSGEAENDGRLGLVVEPETTQNVPRVHHRGFRCVIGMAPVPARS
jgi:hypothetical protein